MKTMNSKETCLNNCDKVHQCICLIFKPFALENMLQEKYVPLFLSSIWNWIL